MAQKMWKSASWYFQATEATLWDIQLSGLETLSYEDYFVIYLKS